MSPTNQDELEASIERTLQNHVGNWIAPDVRFDGFGAWKTDAEARVGFLTPRVLTVYFNVAALDGDDSREALEDVNGIEKAYNWLEGLGVMTEYVYFEIA